MLTYEKVFIDSAHRISGAPSNFKFELPETLQTDTGVQCYTHEVTLPNSWSSIQSELNNILHLCSYPLVPDEDNTNVHYFHYNWMKEYLLAQNRPQNLKKINGGIDNTNFSNTYEVT